MKQDNFKQRQQKWERKQADYKVNSARQATLVLTLKKTLELLGDKRRGRLLDIGCGFGELAILLAKNTDFEIIGFDISKTSVEAARANIKKAGLEGRIKIEEGDVYNLNYPDDYFDAAVSFGYVSAATYPGAQKDVARVLKPEGILICDFINCLSLYKIFGSFKRAVNGNSPYYISLSGIKQKFAKESLIFRKQRFFNTYPPLNLSLSPKVFLVFENTFGRLFKNFLARVRLVCFSYTPK